MDPTAKLNILVVDDEATIRKALTACLESDGHHVTAVGTGQAALQAAAQRVFDLALLDLQLGADKGIDLIAPLMAESPWLKVVIMTAYASIDSAVESIKRGAIDYLPKPFTPAQVALVTQQAASLRALEQQVAGLQEALAGRGGEEDFTSVSPDMQRAITLAQQLAQSDATVLIRGESGTGKGVLAKAIHGWSTRNKRPFAVVSCPSLSAELLESELFGHVRGAFTGAICDNAGRVAAAEGGTLFLDEISDLPLPLQPKLLRFVQDREYERVGSHATRKADVRIIAATNADLDEAVRAGRFRQDLFYRVNVIQIFLPPLRDRVDDIPPLAQRLLAQFTAPSHRIRGFTPDGLRALRNYAWPGNVRELRNVIERAAILCRKDMVDSDQLMLSAPVRTSVPAIGDRISLEQLEEMHIRSVLGSTNSLEEAAAVLGIDTVTLWRRRKKYSV